MPSFVGIRRRRVVRGIAAVLGVSLVFGMVIWLTRPPALVWWTSPPIGNTGRRMRALVPIDWERADQGLAVPPLGAERYYFRPVDRIPKVLRWIFPYRQERAQLSFHVVPLSWVPDPNSDASTIDQYYGFRGQVHRDQVHSAHRIVMFREVGLWLNINYYKSDKRAFDETYKAICNSPRIE
jgi:hypothetical protein